MAIHKIDGVDAVDGGSLINSFPKKFVTLHCSDASGVTKGDFMSIESNAAATDATKNGLGATVIQSNVTAENEKFVFGIAAETTTAAGDVKIQTAGKFLEANVASTVGIGEKLVASSTDGRAQDQAQLHTTPNAAELVTTATYAVAAVALTAASSNKSDVLIIDQGYF